MIVNPSELLRVLGSGVRPGPGPDAATPIEGQGFADLLASVRAGRVASGEPLRLRAGLDASLTDNQLERLRVATDAAQAAGASRLLAVIDGQAVTIDVASRTVDRIDGWPASGVLTDVDAVAAVPDETGTALRTLFAPPSQSHQPSKPMGGMTSIDNASLMDLVAGLRGESRESGPRSAA